jgi:lantibiotic modifying enzyme
MDFDTILRNAKHCEDCSCRLLDKDALEAPSAKLKYLIPFWNYVKQRVDSEITEGEEYFSEGSLCNMREVYLSNLDNWGEKTVLAKILDQAEPCSPYGRYKLLEQYTVGEYQDFWEEYSPMFPQMQRLIVKWTEDFILHVKEIVQRTISAYDELCRVIFKTSPGKVISITGGVADIHGGRCVQLLSFENGSKIVYKPRSLKLDMLWNRYLNFLTEKAGIACFPTYKCVLGDSYGFAEFVHTMPVNTKEEFAEFYYNCGFLLGAVYFLQGSDLHCENMLACGKYPVLIDVETIVRSGNIAFVTDILEKHEAYEKDSVRKTNLLPFITVFKSLKPGSDAFTSKHYHGYNLPFTSDGTYGDGRCYSGQIVDGFCLCYDTLVMYGHELFNGPELLSELQKCEVRILLRNTSEYDRYLKRLKSPECMSDGALFEEKLLNLKKLYFSMMKDNCITPDINRFYLKERASLYDGYIPTISIGLSETLPGSNKYRTAYEYLANKHAQLSQDDKELQCSYITKCLSKNKADYRRGLSIELKPEESLIEAFPVKLDKFLNEWIAKWEAVFSGKIPYGYYVDHITNYFYYTKLEFPFSECFLGLLPAMSSWYGLTGHSGARKILQRIAYEVEKEFEYRNPSIYAEGMSDGLDAICLFAKQTFELTGLESYKHIYQQSLDAIIHKEVKRNCYSEQEVQSLYYSQTASLYTLSVCIKDNKEIKHKLEELTAVKLEQLAQGIQAEPYGLMNGMDGLFLALRSAQPYVSSSLSDETDAYINSYINNLKTTKEGVPDYTVADGLAGHLLCFTDKRFHPETVFLPYLQNISFAYGSAGIIYTLDKLAADNNQAYYRDTADRYASILLNNISLHGIQLNQPSFDPFPSFQFGEGGVVYSLIHHYCMSQCDVRKYSNCMQPLL